MSRWFAVGIWSISDRQKPALAAVHKSYANARLSSEKRKRSDRDEPLVGGRFHFNTLDAYGMKILKMPLSAGLESELFGKVLK